MAAYALGLAHTTCSRATCVHELSTAADGCSGLLYEARAHLATLTDVDRDLRAVAGRLLTVAAVVSAGGAAVATGAT